MRPEVISEAIKNISDEYKLEALELHDQAKVSEITNMKRGISKRLVGVGVAASLALALGITAYATDFFGIKQRDAAPGEKLTVEYQVEDEDGYSTEVVTYDKVSKYVSFEGPESCNKVEFLPSYLPAGYINEGSFGDPTTWGADPLQFFDANYNVYNIELYYTAQFGPDGFMFFEDEFRSVEEAQIGEYNALKMVGHTEGDIDIPDGIESDDDTYYSYDDCYIILQHPDGYIFFLSGEDMGELEKIAQGLSVRATEGVVTYDPSANHQYYMVNGVG